MSRPPAPPAGPVTIEDAKRLLRMTDPITLLDAARLLRIRYAVARRLVLSGKLPSRTLGGRWFIERSAIADVAATKPWSPRAMRISHHRPSVRKTADPALVREKKQIAATVKHAKATSTRKQK